MSVDLKTKLANIDTEYQTLCYRFMAYEQAYDDIISRRANVLHQTEDG